MRLGLRDVLLGPGGARAEYSKSVQPILAAMNSTFGASRQRFAALRDRVAASSATNAAAANASDGRAGLINEIADSAALLHLRAQQLYGLYDYAASTTPAPPTPGPSTRNERLNEATIAINEAWIVMQVGTLARYTFGARGGRRVDRLCPGDRTILAARAHLCCPSPFCNTSAHRASNVSTRSRRPLPGAAAGGGVSGPGGPCLGLGGWPHGVQVPILVGGADAVLLGPGPPGRRLSAHRRVVEE